MPSFNLPCPHCRGANDDLSGLLMRARGEAVWLACRHCGKGFRCSLRDCAGRDDDASLGRAIKPIWPMGIELSARTGTGRGAQDLLDANLELAEYLASGVTEHDLDELDAHFRVSSQKGRH